RRPSPMPDRGREPRQPLSAGMPHAGSAKTNVHPSAKPLLADSNSPAAASPAHLLVTNLKPATEVTVCTYEPHRRGLEPIPVGCQTAITRGRKCLGSRLLG